MRSPHPLAGKTVGVTITGHSQLEDGQYDYRVEDWWQNVHHESWAVAALNGNFAARLYTQRLSRINIPMDDEVLYGKIHGLGYLVHVSELNHA